MEINQRRAGVILSYSIQAVQVLTGLVYTPIMIRILGQSEYGIYQLSYSIVTNLGLLNLGFNASYMRFYSREKVNNNDEQISKLNGMFMLIFLSMMVMCLVAGALLVSNLRQIVGHNFSTDEYRKMQILMILMIINLALTFPNSVFSCIVIAHERFVFQKTVLLLQTLMSPMLSLPLLLIGYGSVGITIVSLLLTVIVLIWNGIFCIRRLKAGFIFRDLKFSILKEMFIFTFFIFLNQLIDQVNWNVDKFLLGRFKGTISVAIYSVGGQINTMYLQLSTAISGVFIPKVNKIVAESNDTFELSEIFRKIGRIQFVIMSFALTIIVYFGASFIRYWVGREYGEAYYVALLLTIPVTIPLVKNIGIEIQRAQNKHQIRSLVYLMIAFANVVVSIFLVQIWGPIGAAIGTAVSLVLGNGLFMNWYYYRIMHIDILSFWKSLSNFIPTLLITALIGIPYMLLVKNESIFVLISAIILYGMVFGVSVYNTGMNDDEKTHVKEIFNRISRFC